ncbi:MAG: hypothetical protein DRJ08_01045 [Acidobacteria bacterium]|nr:MAG: hypothetical protein DRJ08_01045 [Acidobacteriota bacterium]
MKKTIWIAATTLMMAAATIAQAGVIYSAKTSTELYGEAAEAQRQNPMAQQLTAPQEMKIFAQDKGARIKFLTDSVLYKKGDFMVTEDGSVMYICDPKAKTYHKLDLNELRGKAEGMMKTMKKMTKMSYSNVFVNLVDKGNAGTVAGYPVKKYRMLVEYDTNMKILFKKIKNHERKEYFIYVTPKLPMNLVPEYSNSQMFTTGVDQVDSQIQEKLKGLGFPMKTEQLSYGKNNEMTSKSTFEITSIKEKSLNPALFKLPNGYTEKELQVEGTDSEGNTQKQKFKMGDLFK